MEAIYEAFYTTFYKGTPVMNQIIERSQQTINEPEGATKSKNLL